LARFKLGAGVPDKIGICTHHDYLTNEYYDIPSSQEKALVSALISYLAVDVPMCLCEHVKDSESTGRLFIDLDVKGVANFELNPCLRSLQEALKEIITIPTPDAAPLNAPSFEQWHVKPAVWDRYSCAVLRSRIDATHKSYHLVWPFFELTKRRIRIVRAFLKQRLPKYGDYIDEKMMSLRGPFCDKVCLFCLYELTHPG
jgi:hypothetical protein